MQNANDVNYGVNNLVLVDLPVAARDSCAGLAGPSIPRDGLRRVQLVPYHCHSSLGFTFDWCGCVLAHLLPAPGGQEPGVVSEDSCHFWYHVGNMDGVAVSARRRKYRGLLHRTGAYLLQLSTPHNHSVVHMLRCSSGHDVLRMPIRNLLL